MQRFFRVFTDLYKIYFRSVCLLLSYPKSGSTLLRFILLNYFLLKEGRQANLSHRFLNRHMPEVFQRSSRANHFYPYFKTHHLLPTGRNRMVVCLRKPYDCLCSYYLYSLRMQPDRYRSLDAFLASSEGIKKYRGILRYLERRLHQHPTSTFTFVYEDYLQHPRETIRDLLVFIDPAARLDLSNTLSRIVERKNVVEWERVEQDEAIQGFSTRKDYEYLREQIGQEWWIEMKALEEWYALLRKKAVQP